MFRRGNPEDKKRKLKIVTNTDDLRTLRPGDSYTLNVKIDFSRNETTIDIAIPITFHWDGFVLRKVDGP